MYSIVLCLALLTNGTDKDQFKMGGATAPPVIAVQSVTVQDKKLDETLAKLAESLDSLEKRLANLEKKPIPVASPAPVAAPATARVAARVAPRPAPRPAPVASAPVQQQYYYQTPTNYYMPQAVYGSFGGYTSGSCSTGQCGR